MQTCVCFELVFFCSRDFAYEIINCLLCSTSCVKERGLREIYKENLLTDGDYEY